ncbi:stealth conserved region 3 domain-containing protein [Selenomonas ruminantium]|uniref:stealth conserved region 3 domain-containing protein n=1 Tax=Selenomonas ruminantium TaxID=971 RepID=UPI0026EEE0A5|nr:stealth conserved region 3 domain-containing protein [Selenomonas ruminantium]
MSDIDCVILWVDGSDKKWITSKNKFLTSNNKLNEDAEAERFRDYGILKYLFRGIEENMSWVRNVFFVTCGQYPKWLNKSCKKLKLVDHKDFIPQKYLPTFNANTIEMNLHRIEGLSEKFIYFNDDMFVLKKTKKSDFFCNGLPCDTAVFNAIAMKKSEKEFRFLMPINDIEIINKHFIKKESLKKNFFKYLNPKYGIDIFRTICLMPWIHFTGFYNYHFPYSLTKSTLHELWKREFEILDRTCSHKFRNSDDVNIWLALYWQYASGNFYPRSPKIGYLTSVSDDDCTNDYVYEHIKKQKTKLIVINDNVKKLSPDKISNSLIKAFETVLPEKSSFEL